jgi:hypothetical protein
VPTAIVVTFFPKSRLAETLENAAKQQKILYVKAEREGDGYRHIGTNPRSASPVGDTISRLRASSKILTPSSFGKPGGGAGFNDTPPKFQRAPLAVRPLSAQGRAHRNTGMQGPLFVPDRRVWEGLTQASASIWQRLRAGGEGASDAVDRARFKFQDRFLPVLRAQEAIVRETGNPLPLEHNAYIAETTFSGKVGKHLFDIDEQFTKPIIKIIADAKGLTAEDVGTWLYARHAVERNARIATINPDLQDGGSGMTDAEAAQILSDAKAGPYAAELQRIGDLVDALRERTLHLREVTGLITSEDADSWRRQYKHYVPLKGFADTEFTDATLDLGRGMGAKRLSTRGPESKRALGRGSEAFNPLQAALTQAQEVAVRAEKNVVGQTFFELAKDFPSPALWEVKTPKQARYFNRSTGLVETRIEDPVSMILEPNEMAVKVGGKEVRILLHDERLAQAAGTLGADQMSGAWRVLSMLSRFFSMTRTMLNPEFLLTNAFRDFQTAQFNIQAFGEADKNAIALAMTKNWRKALLGAMRGSSGRFDTEWSRYYDEFQKSGAQVSFWNIEQPEVARDDLNRRIDLARGSKAARTLKVMTSPRALFSMRDNAVLDFMERSNLAVDNAIRLAAYVEARKRGWTKSDAAFLAKELTVNFNRRGDYGSRMNALYPFFNAAIQGSVRTIKAISSKRVAKMVLMAFGLGLLNDLINAALSEEDDDHQLLYDKIPDYRSQRNIHLVGWGTGENPAAIPMPYGYNVFPYAGQQLGKVIRGVKKPEDAFRDVVGSIMGAFMPVQGGTTDSLSSWGTTVSPFIFDPFIEMLGNENFAGNSIYPRFPKEGVPDAYVAYPSVTETSKWVAETLGSLTGGDFRTPGAVDVSPETLDHLASFVVGSAGAFWGRSFDIVAKSLSGNFEEIERRDVPFLRNTTTPVGEWVDRNRYYIFRAEVRDAEEDRKAYEAARLPVPTDVARKAALYDATLKADRELNGEGKWRLKGPSAKYPQNVSPVAREERKVYLDFNGKFIKAMGSRAE